MFVITSFICFTAFESLGAATFERRPGLDGRLTFRALLPRVFGLVWDDAVGLVAVIPLDEIPAAGRVAVAVPLLGDDERSAACGSNGE